MNILRVVERAAIASARTMGLGDGHKADQVAVEAMRTEMDTVGMDGTIVIGEGERDEAPMLFIGEKVGVAHTIRTTNIPPSTSPSTLWKARICARPASQTAITVLAASEAGRPAARARSLHGKNHCGPDLCAERRGARCSAWNTTSRRSPSGSTAT